MLPEGGFVSASHDMSLRVWSEAGVCGGVLQGHTAIVYSVTALLQGMLASGGCEVHWEVLFKDQHQC